MTITTIKQADFTLSLPGSWQSASAAGPDLWQYTSETGAEQLSVSIHVSRTPIDVAERPGLLKEFQAMRLNTERGRIAEPSQHPLRDTCIGMYSGVDEESQRRFSNLTIVNSEVIANFYYEALDMTQGDFVERSASVLKGVALVSVDA